ncbi:Chromosome-partitioning protein Spo0J [Pirellula sp. SH-Sr6A]|uniref:DNA modification methylase n=1 Tax=Pirellula sp. SH-Sr6A TaxID=1632865 RepID=UPI00078DDE33|nr:DNA methyltransferase [Pirellula sp. SH-Sr6A]AMV35225.1 Chromosome-partitioning protein Spo0J [Pirellula sp. SH-Sr6A]
MKIEQRSIADIKPYPNNPRINDDAVDAVAGSIKEFGFRQPIVVDEDGVIICGHTRFKAAQKLGIEKLPVHVAKDLTPEQIKAYRIADNKTAELAEWNYDLLPIELGDLQANGFDLSLLGFDTDELAKLMDTGVNEGLTDPDEVPAPPDEAITKPGDLWILGNHRLLCGDSSSPADLGRLLAGNAIHLCNTDPPYNVKVEPRSNNAIAAGLSSFSNDAASGKLKQGQGNAASFGVDHETGKPKHAATHKKLRPKDRPLANDFVSDGEFDRLLDAWFGNIARVLLPGRCFYIWGGYANLGNYPPFLSRHALYFSQSIVWDKQHPVLTRKDFMGAFELAFYGWKEGAGHKYYGPNNATDLWQVKKVNPQSMIHLTEKPVELAVRAMQYSSVPGENVLDLFGGSGSTLIAAEQCGRNAFLMELDCLYADVIVDRYQRFTGKPAILERTGESPIPMRAADAK